MLSNGKTLTVRKIGGTAKGGRVASARSSGGTLTAAVVVDDLAGAAAWILQNSVPISL